MSTGRMNRIEDLDGNPLWDKDLGGILGNVTTSTGTQTVVEALDERVVKIGAGVDVREFGAVCDGVTDDSVAVQSALDYLYGLGGGTLQVPNGFCGIGETIETPTAIRNPTQQQVNSFTLFSSGITITGLGKNSGFKALPSLQGKKMFHCYAPIDFDNLGFDGNDLTGLSLIYLDFFVGHTKQTVNKCLFFNVLGDGTICVNSDGATLYVMNCTMRRPYIGIRLGNASMNGLIFNNTITNGPLDVGMCSILLEQTLEGPENSPQGNIIKGNYLTGGTDGIIVRSSFVLMISGNIIGTHPHNGRDVTLDNSVKGITFRTNSFVDPDTLNTYQSRISNTVIRDNWVMGEYKEADEVQNGRSIWIGSHVRRLVIDGNTFPVSAAVQINSGTTPDLNLTANTDFSDNGVPTAIRITNNNFVNYFNTGDFKMLYIEGVRDVEIGSGNEFFRSTFVAKDVVNLELEKQLRLPMVPTYVNLMGKIFGWEPLPLTVTTNTVGSVPVTYTTDTTVRITNTDVEVTLGVTIEDVGTGNDGDILISGFPLPRSTIATACEVRNTLGYGRIPQGTDTMAVRQADGSSALTLNAPFVIHATFTYPGSFYVFSDYAS